MKNQAKKQFKENNENGNVLVIVLITIALLAALTFAFIDGDKGSNTSTLSKGELKVTAGQIMKYARSIENGVKQLQLVNGCSEGELNFDATGFPWHDNTNAPSDKSCDLFAVEGAGLSAPTEEPLTGTFSGRIAIEGIGTDAADLVYFNHFETAQVEICNQLNSELGITYAGTQPPSDRTANSGIFGLVDPYIYPTPTKPSLWVGEGDGCCESGAVIFAGKKSGCFTHGNTGNSYSFYHVLIAR